MAGRSLVKTSINGPRLLIEVCVASSSGEVLSWPRDPGCSERTGPTIRFSSDPGSDTPVPMCLDEATNDVIRAMSQMGWAGASNGGFGWPVARLMEAPVQSVRMSFGFMRATE